jgi:hypothetical protein
MAYGTYPIGLIPLGLYSFTATGGVLSVTITPDGGLVFTGVAANARSITRTPLGGITFSGVGIRSYGVIRTPVGGLNLSGVAGYSTGLGAGIATRIVTPTGGIVFSGAAGRLQGSFRIASGGFVLSGVAPITRQSGGALGTVYGAYNDVIYAKRGLAGKVGAFNDRLDENVYWRDLVGGSTKPLNDVKRQVLGTGQLNDVEKQYWKDL